MKARNWDDRKGSKKWKISGFEACTQSDPYRNECDIFFLLLLREEDFYFNFHIFNRKNKSWV